MDLLIIENHGIHLFLETIKGRVITFYIVPDIKSNVRISVGTFVVAQQFVLQRNTMKFDIIVI